MAFSTAACAFSKAAPLPVDPPLSFLSGGADFGDGAFKDAVDGLLNEEDADKDDADAAAASLDAAEEDDNDAAAAAAPPPPPPPEADDRSMTPLFISRARDLR